MNAFKFKRKSGGAHDTKLVIAKDEDEAWEKLLKMEQVKLARQGFAFDMELEVKRLKARFKLLKPKEVEGKLNGKPKVKRVKRKLGY